MQLLEMVDSLVDLVVPDDSAVLGVVKDLVLLRNAADHQLAVCAAVIDESGMASKAGYSRDGFLSSEHVDVVVRGVGHVVGRSAGPVTAEQRMEFEGKLLSHAISGAPPEEFSAEARALGNQIADDTGGVPPAEDKSLNALDYKANSDGRCVGKFDVDAVTGEKLFSALDLWSRPVIVRDGCCVKCGDIDPQRKPLPAYNRRTLTLAA